MLEAAGPAPANPVVPQRFASVPGISVALALAATATLLARFVPLVGAPVIGVALGAALSTTLGRRADLGAGLSRCSGIGLQLGVVLLGTGLSLREVGSVGSASLPVMLGTLAVCLTLAWLLGRRLAIEFELRTLIGVGTAICGASAIAAVSPAIRARNPAIAYAISTIFVFNVVAVLVFPPIGHALGLSQHAFGLFAGTAVNDTSSVVAAATTYGSAAASYAVVVKLTRTLMIIPITFGLAALMRRRHAATTHVRAWRLVPWFLVGFLLAATANSLGLIPSAAVSHLQQIAAFLVTTALCAIGLSTDVAAIRRAGVRPLLFGACLWLAVAVTSLLLQAAVV